MKVNDININTLNVTDDWCDEVDIANDTHQFSEETLFIKPSKSIKVRMGEFFVSPNFKRFSIATSVFLALGASGLYFNKPLPITSITPTEEAEHRTVNAGIVSHSEKPVIAEPVAIDAAIVDQRVDINEESSVLTGSDDKVGAIKNAIDQAFNLLIQENKAIEAKLKSKEEQIIIFSNEITKAKDEIDAVNTKLNGQSEVAKSLESQKNQLQSEKEALALQVTQSGDLSQKLADKDLRIAEIEAAMNAMGENQKKAQSEITGLSSEIEKLNEENDGLRRDNGNLNIKLSELRTSIRKGGKVAASEASPKADSDLSAVKTAVIKEPKAIAPKAKKDPLQGLIIIGLTEDKVVALKDNKPITISIGSQWNGVLFNSIDKATGVVSTSAGKLTMK